MHCPTTDAAQDPAVQLGCRWFKRGTATLAVSEDPCVVTIAAAPDGNTLWIRLVGAIEMGAEAALDTAIARVQTLTPGTVVIDLAGVTFAGSLLLHFLIRLHAAAPRASIGLRHAKPTIRSILTVTGVHELVILDDHRSP